MTQEPDKELLHIFDPVFRCNFYYILETDHKKFCEIIKDRLNIVMEPKDYTDGRFLSNMRGDTEVGLIWTRNRLPWIIAHEAHHAACWSLDKRGIPLTIETEEVYSYVLQFLVREITEYLQDRFADSKQELSCENPK